MAAIIKTLQALLQTKIVLGLKVAQFFVALALFTYLALMPATYIPTAHSDHTLHFVGNILLFLSASVAAHGRMKLGILILLLVPYSMLIEVAQWLSPSRQVDSADIVANMLGLICGFIIVHTVEWAWGKLVAYAHS